MNYICRLSLIIISGSITGSIFTIVWIFLKKCFKKQLRTDIIFNLLKCVIISYFVPSTLIILSIKSRYVWNEENYYLFFTTPMKWILTIILAVVAILAIIKTIRWINTKRKIDKELMVVGEAKDYQIEMINEIKERIGLKRNFEAWRVFDVSSSYVYGLFKTKVYISTDEYEEKDMKNILTHELYHIKKGDVYFEPIVVAMLCINWFNPLSWYLIYQYKMWSEADCDFKCFTRGGISYDDYMNTMLTFVKMKIEKQNMNTIAMAAGHSEIVDRADCARTYSQNKVNKIIVTLLLLFSLLLGGTTVYAATDVTEKIYNKLFLNTCSWREEDKQTGFDENQEIEEITKADNIYYIDNRNEIKYEDVELTKTVLVDIANNDKDNVVYLVKDINEAGVLNINFRIDNANNSDNIENKVFVGIIEPDGKIRYIEVKDTLNHDFEIKKLGDYKVFIENRSGIELRTGWVIKFTPDKED